MPDVTEVILEVELVVFVVLLELLDVVVEELLDVVVELVEVEDVVDVAEVDELLVELIDWRVAFISTTV